MWEITLNCNLPTEAVLDQICTTFERRARAMVQTRRKRAMAEAPSFASDEEDVQARDAKRVSPQSVRDVGAVFVGEQKVITVNVPSSSSISTESSMLVPNPQLKSNICTLPSKVESLCVHKSTWDRCFESNMNRPSVCLKPLHTEYSLTILEQMKRLESLTLWQQTNWQQWTGDFPRSFIQMTKLYMQCFQFSESSIAAFFRGAHMLDLAAHRLLPNKNQWLTTVCGVYLLASKVEDIYPPEVNSLVQNTDYSFSRDELLNKEREIMSQIQYNVAFPTRWDFAQYFAFAAQLSTKWLHMYQYLLTLSFIDAPFHSYLPSTVAAAALHLTRQMSSLSSQSTVWTEQMQKVTSLEEKDLVEIVLRLRKLHWRAQAILPSNILQYFSSDSRDRIVEIPALQYRQLSFFSQGSEPLYGLPLTEDK